MQRYQTGPRQDIRYAVPGFQRTVENLVAAQPCLSGIQGLITSMVLLVRNLAVSTYQCEVVKNVDLLDPSGASILGGTPIDNAYINLVYGASQQLHFDPASTWANAVQIPVSGPHVARAEMAGHVESFIPFQGNHQLRFTPQLTGPYQVSVIVHTVGMLSIERGQLSATVS